MKRKQNNKATNWDLYYEEQPPDIILKGRKIHEDLLVKFLEGKNIKTALEYGGANSKIAEKFVQEFNLNEILIVDNNEYGLEITKKNNKTKNLRIQLGDILNLDIPKKYDLVYSIGLIEHFSIEGTRKCIKRHVEVVNSGGYVLLSFPTPTLQYRVVRFGLELLGKWRFSDERPLKIDEVVKELSKYGKIQKTIVNYKLLATQAVVLFQKD